MEKSLPLFKTYHNSFPAFDQNKTSSFFKPIIQPKLSINQPSDIYEQQADAMADKLMRMNDTSVSTFFKPSVTNIQRKCRHCEEEKQMQRKENNHASTIASVETEGYINSLSGGKNLSPQERNFFEPRMGYDFSDVKIHTDPKANQSAKNINALAYTTGNNIVFGSNQYQPETDNGRRLLSHELTHVVQQTKENTISKSISRYSHDSSCKEDDLKAIVWPGDHAAKLMANNALRILRLAPADPKLAPLYKKYFMTSTPDISKMISVFNSVRAAFDGNNYQYECVNKGCDYNGEVTTLPLIGGIGDIRLCVEHLSGKSAMCIGRTILHEFTHYFWNTDDNAYCKDSCGYGSCPATLTKDKAIDNADSFACFAYELYALNISASSPPAKTASAGESPAGSAPVDAGLPGGI